ncbi:ferredoxin [Streptomyces sediminimaris]|uniref:ferredoxin n=1 Tax=Streptomyces sediminimaris TaxID=3383721 RepID=UPI00399BFE20
MHIVSDTDKCVGAGQCVYSAPEFFDQDEDAIVIVVDEAPEAGRFALVRSAVDRCPSGALSLVEDRVAEDRLAGDRMAEDRVAGDRVAGDRMAGDRVEG